MFGYIAINKAEMKFRDFDIYHAYYCGLCKDLKERYGRSGQITLSYDMTFLIILLSGLYEPPAEDSIRNCVANLRLEAGYMERLPSPNGIFPGQIHLSDGCL